MANDHYAGLQSALDPRGVQAARIDDLWWLFLIISLVVWVAVGVAVVLALWRRHRQVIVRPQRETGKVRVVAVATGMTAVTLLVLVAYSAAVGRAISGTPDASERPLTVLVTGHQWWWEIEYEDPVPSRRFLTANELRIPVGRPVVVRLASRDVIHSFWVPNLHGKIDLVPGRTNRLWLRADAPGEYRGQCAEFCGLQHARMGFLVVALAERDFETWAERQRAARVEPQDDVARWGEEVFLSSQCSLCHTVRGTAAAAGRIAPDLTHVGGRRTLAAGTLRNTRGNLAGWILDPQRIKPGSFMPPTHLAPDDLQALLAYLEGLE